MTKSNSKTDLLSTIVASYAARPDVDSDDIVALVAKLSRELGLEVETETQPAATPAATAPAPGGLTPALPLDKAVTEEKVYCLCCGKGFKMLKRHLGAEHGLTEAEYRTAFGLPEDMPLVAPSYSRRKASYAKEVGFGKYARTGGGVPGKGERVS
ncbi:MucR family transcriptional regulator [Limimaricola pyoseonensis]|uniref:Predicted transcriptional regulator n=1 Tax=Limimaricola pyoseonensis TaxID=521013 RepID=A0A1G7KB41_9RHOB|nr:MucR family transcriptional regulator [Limimaricola pyoseonensis]SDF34059.1 Predicted transcriptional regulator [Limimaricola pyoseonensis]